MAWPGYGGPGCLRLVADTGARERGRPRLRGLWRHLYCHVARLALGRRGSPAGSMGYCGRGDLFSWGCDNFVGATGKLRKAVFFEKEPRNFCISANRGCECTLTYGSRVARMAAGPGYGGYAVAVCTALDAIRFATAETACSTSVGLHWITFAQQLRACSCFFRWLAAPTHPRTMRRIARARDLWPPRRNTTIACQSYNKDARRSRSLTRRRIR